MRKHALIRNVNAFKNLLSIFCQIVKRMGPEWVSPINDFLANFIHVAHKEGIREDVASYLRNISRNVGYVTKVDPLVFRRILRKQVKHRRKRRVSYKTWLRRVRTCSTTAVLQSSLPTPSAKSPRPNLGKMKAP